MKILIATEKPFALEAISKIRGVRMKVMSWYFWRVTQARKIF